MIDTSNFTARAEKLLCENILPFWIARMADSNQWRVFTGA